VRDIREGEVFGMLEFIGYTKPIIKRPYHKMGKFECECGIIVTKQISDVLRKSKHPQNCGCARKRDKTKTISFDAKLMRAFLKKKLV